MRKASLTNLQFTHTLNNNYMKRRPSVRLYRVEIKLMTYSIFNYFDGKQSFLKNIELLKEQNKNVIGYKYVCGAYKPI
jgi:hypothetical protein